MDLRLGVVLTGLTLAAALTACGSATPSPPHAQSQGAGTTGGEAPPAGQMKPLDGGQYTWANGVSLSLKVVKKEPWGSTDDYCGDGSCGISHPNDLRWVLRYTISVPAKMAAPFDPSGCPGQLHVVNGSDAESLIGVAGNFDEPITGVIFPGATKHGQDEYSIARSAVGKKFYLQSTCGVTGDSSESAFFTGAITE